MLSVVGKYFIHCGFEGERGYVPYVQLEGALRKEMEP